VSIEQAIRTMLTAGNTVSLVPDARVTCGYRLQDTVLPAITYEVQSVELASCGASPTRMAEVEVRSIADLAVDALAIAAQVRSAAVPGTYSTFSLDAVVYVGHSLEEPGSGEGDEQQPAEAVSRFTVYYRE
jgi:hypothetical protein